MAATSRSSVVPCLLPLPCPPLCKASLRSQSSMALDLRDKELFPAFEQLPSDTPDDGYDVDYFEFDEYLGIIEPIHHWCLLVEITEVVPYIRPTYYGKDVDGTAVFIVFYTDDRSPQIARNCNVGDTLALMYAETHMFNDGQVGIRVDSDDYVKVFHSTLQGVFRIDELLNSKMTSCHLCDKPAKSQCINCEVKYCSKDCQVADWKPRHKDECRVGKCIKQWKSFNWWDFDDYRSL
ncbi:hypothetical protein AGABI2DRAFT_139276 [Agaricus bisporus var. bisporus H97]|uniref:hypothetical protein n=1 Tax=Agaricus bisporus var. bisporus (strain H97 / ATCC MYA-4626 / FGSC 10389) TaxID=936046 RepID=UPI00029F7DF4|nr:hypothetical protein AGABI2DRAFT_139276 [Agaricus bisporus var. bisporus H97]EKV42884.1 hypothetical protein AGABI2DRAFT_139276 [Agaricus bisporus var. bisporus H97]